MKFFRAIYDKTLYQEALSEKFSKPFFYWVGISILSLFITAIFLGISTYRSLPSLEEIKQEIPYFEIENGKLNIEQKQELYIEETPMLIILDDEYVFDVEDFRYTPQYLIATEEFIYLKGEDSQMNQISYSDFEWLENTDRDILINSIKDIIPTQAILVVILFVLIFFLFIAIFLLVFSFFPILLWALVGLLTSKIFKKNLTFGDSLKIMLYGNTLPTIVGTVYWIIFRNNINMLLSFILVSTYTGYFIYKINPGDAIRGEALTTEPTIPTPSQPVESTPIQGTPQTQASVPTQQPTTTTQPIQPQTNDEVNTQQ